MKVCHFTSAHPATDGRIFKKECCSLAKSGYEVYLVAPNAKTEILNNVHVIGIEPKYTGRFYRMFFLARYVYLAALKVEADIYHFHDPELLPYGLKLKRKGKKVIFDSHEDVVNQIRQKKYLFVFSTLVAYIYKIYEKYALSKFDAVVSVTPHIVKRLKLTNPLTYQITNYPIIYNLEKKYNLAEKKAYMAFAGGISPMWMHDKIIETLSFLSLPDFRYKIAGISTDSYLMKMKSLNNWNRVDYLGVLNSEGVESLYRHATLGIALLDYVPNVGGHIGTLGNNKIFEMMAAGIPIICTDFELWKEIIEKWECGVYVNPHDHLSIVNAINEIIENPSWAQTMGNHGIEAVYSEYNWKTQESILLEMYDCIRKV